MTDFWRTRRRAVETRLRDGLRNTGDQRPHYVVCGQDALVFHLVNALLAEPVRVTVIVPRQRPAEGPDVRSVRGVRLIRSDRLDEDTFRAAGLVGARGLALMHQDDVGNIHAALCAQAVEPKLRVVLRMFNTTLGNAMKQLLTDCAVLSDAAMAAPAFVAAALGEVAPTHFRYGRRTLYVARRADVRPEQVLCPLADTRDPHRFRVLPAEAGPADLVLAEATGQPAGPEVAARRINRARRLRRPGTVLARALRSFATRKIGIATLVVLGIVAVFGILLSLAEGVTMWNAVYLTLVTTIGGDDPHLEKGASVKIMQVVLTLAGLALVPLITAAVLDGMVNARLAVVRARRSGHVVVVGLGNVGTRVMRQLHDLGVEVVAVDKDPQARGAAIAHQLNIPLIVGDAAREEILAAASVDGCRALVVVSTDDVTNLQAALNGRTAQSDLRVVLRLFDGDLAERVQRTFNIGVSRSVSYLAAPAFSAALLKRPVLVTIPVGRHVLLVAEVPVAAGSALVGRTVDEVCRHGAVRVIALTPAGQLRPEWSPVASARLAAGDVLVVVLRRAELSGLLARASAAPMVPGPALRAGPTLEAGPVRTPPAIAGGSAPAAEPGTTGVPASGAGPPAGGPAPGGVPPA